MELTFTRAESFLDKGCQGAGTGFIRRMILSFVSV